LISLILLKIARFQIENCINAYRGFRMDTIWAIINPSIANIKHYKENKNKKIPM